MKATLTLDHAEMVARRIIERLEIKPGMDTSLEAVMDLTGKWGGRAVVTPLVPKRHAGWWIRDSQYEDVPAHGKEGMIIISAHIEAENQPGVIIHELAHRLALAPNLSGYFGAVGYAAECRNKCYQELIALNVEREFLKCGGVGFRTIRQVNNRLGKMLMGLMQGELTPRRKPAKM